MFQKMAFSFSVLRLTHTDEETRLQDVRCFNITLIIQLCSSFCLAGVPGEKGEKGDAGRTGKSGPAGERGENSAATLLM